MNAYNMEPTKKVEVSAFDKAAYPLLRKHVYNFLKESAKSHDAVGKIVLDIAPQIHEGAGFFFKQAQVETLDIDPQAHCTYTADITQDTSAIIPAERYDIVVCTEVLEHTLQPFDAVKQIHRILKKEGLILLSAPFNFRIHGPLPDCFRFTEYGLRALLKDFKIVSLKELATNDRTLMPIHYTVVARKSDI